jgi:hypothetical protein
MLTLFGHDLSGTTAQRPTNATIGQPFFDTTIGQQLFWNGTAWVTTSGTTPEAVAVGAVAGTGVAVSERGTGQIRKSVFTLTGLSIAMTDAGAAGSHGSQKIYDFPEGNILVLGATTDLQILAGAGGITDTAAVVGAIGSVPTATDNATLTSTEANIVPSTAATLTGGAGDFDGQSTGVAVLDGTATPADAYLNFAVPDAGSSANDTLTVNGTITIVWMSLGDN